MCKCVCDEWSMVKKMLMMVKNEREGMSVLRGWRLTGGNAGVFRSGQYIVELLDTFCIVWLRVVGWMLWSQNTYVHRVMVSVLSSLVDHVDDVAAGDANDDSIPVMLWLV